MNTRPLAIPCQNVNRSPRIRKPSKKAKTGIRLTKAAAWLAGMQAGVYPAMQEFSQGWALERRFEPAMDSDTRSRKYKGWKRAVAATLAV